MTPMSSITHIRRKKHEYLWFAAALITAVLACVGLLSLSTAPAWAAAGTITEFPIPPAESGPAGITTGPDGNLWFTLSFGNSIGRITTEGLSTAFPLPRTCGNKFGCSPQGITAGPAHTSDVWFTELRGDKIGRIITQ